MGDGTYTYGNMDNEDDDDEPERDFIGMSPKYRSKYSSGEYVIFDSCFESGNLDKVHAISGTEYDLYMRVDSNTRGSRQWFYFKVTSKIAKTIKFNVVNFTKKKSLYEQGMKVCIKSEATEGLWVRGGDNIEYKLSKISSQG